MSPYPRLPPGSPDCLKDFPLAALMRVGAVAAALGGAAWLIKAVAILATGDQPPLVFEVAPLMFALALLGMRAMLGARPQECTGVVGGWAAAVAAALAVASLAMTFGASSSGEGFSPLTFSTFLCVLGGLILIGLASRHRTELARPVRVLPLLLGVFTFPLVAVGGVLEAVNERLLELPLVVLGLAWIVLGRSMWTGPAAARAHHGG